MRRQQKEKSEAVGLARKRKQEKSFEELLRQEEENRAGKMDEADGGHREIADHRGLLCSFFVMPSITALSGP